MLLRRLEAYGFKSFADKTEIDFGAGITVIVGPNGSGKSNISDAIRWVLGEQSVRNLRGTKMEDVIFAGSAGRRALGVAEVSLTFDNTDGSLPLDFNEVIITRRVFRSGESEYFINKSHCRLKDIYDLLADTGLGRDAMTVIGQNKVDEVLNSKPEDRRLLFEEAAGITKYKQRKKEALRKLEDTNANLLRVLDITTEIETQLAPLAQSAEKTKLYNEIQTELTACQVTLLINKLVKAEKMVESAAAQKEHLTDQDISINTNLISKEMAKDQIFSQVTDNETALNALQANLVTIQTEIERAHGKSSLLKERIEQGKRAQIRMLEDMARLDGQKSDYEQKTGDILRQCQEKEELLKFLKTSLGERVNSYKEMVSAIEGIEHRLEQHKEKSFDHMQELVHERNNLVNFERDLAKLEIKQQNIIKEQEDYQQQLTAATQLCDNALQEQKLLNESLRTFQEQAQKLDLEKNEKEQQLMRILQQEESLVSKINELKSRYKVLQSMQHEYEGFARGIKSILKSTQQWRGGVCGAVAEIIHAPDKYVTALEVALGGALQHIVTKDDQTAKQAMYFLKRQNLGRATFLPLNTIRGKKPKENEVAASRTEGSLGFAADIVQCDPCYRSIVEFLLGRTIVAQNIDVAIKIAKQNAFSLRIVTLDGELVNPGGSMTGGSLNKREAGLLSRGNDLQHIEAQLSALHEQLDTVNDSLASCRDDVSKITAQLAEGDKKRQEIQIRQAEIGVHLEKLQVDRDRQTMALTLLAEETQGYLGEKAQITQLSITTREKIAALENRDVEHKQNFDEWQSQLKELQEQREGLQGQVTDLKVQVGSLEKEISSFSLNLDQFMQLQHTVQVRLDTLQAEACTLNNQITQADGELRECDEACQALTAQKTELEEKQQLFYAVKMNHTVSLQNIEKEIKDIRRRQNDVQARLHESELLYTKYTYEMDYCQEQLQRQFALTVERARMLCRTESNEVLNSLIHKFEQQIAEIGPVNPAAIEEYARLKERYEFLQKQYDDLMSAKDYLSSIIKDIDHTMATQFSTAFKKINEYFSDIFIRLFGGGKAELKLVEPSEILDSGIEIIVQPPGKKLQNLVLLSGGERALTVIALLFSFLTYKPAPFIVTDEIDAALDESNVERFSNFLRDYARNTQFIVVTHRKGTMECADIIHGVTIEESGVSRLVSVKLMDKAV